jgi:hypothetical protein
MPSPTPTPTPTPTPSTRPAWFGYGHDAQHTAVSATASQDWLGAKIGLSDSEQTIVFFAGMALYAVPFLFDLARSLREARRLFPRSGTQ